MKNARILLGSLSVFLLSTVSSFADCPGLQDGLNRKMNSYRLYRDANQSIEDHLALKARECKTEGEEVTREAAKLTEGRNCETQDSARKLDEKVKSLGTRCKTVYFETEEAQKELKKKFDRVKADLDAGMEAIHSLPYVQQDCKDEIATAEVMVKAFLKLESGIISVQKDAHTGGEDYKGMAAITAALAARNEAIQKDCGVAQPNVNSGGVSEAGKKSKGMGTGFSGTPQKNSASSITGTKEASDAAKKSRDIVNQAPPKKNP